MKATQKPEESLYPVMQFLPVLTVTNKTEISAELLKAFSMSETAKVSCKTADTRHYVCHAEGLCHKKQALHLFLTALAVFNKSQAASTLWLSQDTSKDMEIQLIEGTLSMTEPIQLFLQQSGFGIEAKETLASFSDAKFLMSLLLAPSMSKVA